MPMLTKARGTSSQGAASGPRPGAVPRPDAHATAREDVVPSLVKFEVPAASVHVEPPGCIDVLGVGGRVGMSREIASDIWLVRLARES